MDAVEPKAPLLCPKGNHIAFACIQDKCTSSTSLHCQNESCEICKKAHPKCKHVPLGVLVGFLHWNFEQQKHAFHQTVALEHQIGLIIRKSQESILKQVFTAGLPSDTRKVLNDVFRHQKIGKISPKQMAAVKEAIDRHTPVNKEAEIKQFCDQSLDAIKNIVIKKQQLLFSNPREYDDWHSKLVTKKSEIDFIRQSLGNPKSLQLLFRASQNEFSSQKFHAKCDNIQNTFVLIRTQFGKTIAGFTPIKWNAVKQGPASDPSNRSFLLSLDMKQKMHLNNSKSAIYCSPRYGPTFGQGHDIYISDKCNKNSNSGTYFPSSYNSKEHHLGEEVWKQLTGSKGGYSFKVVDYEVFKVIY